MARGAIGSPIRPLEMRLPVSVLAFSIANSTWILLLHGLLRMPRVASELILPAIAPTGIVLPSGRFHSGGVKETNPPKLESYVGESLRLQSGLQPTQYLLRMSA